MARSKKPRCRNCQQAWIENTEPVGCNSPPPRVRFLVSPRPVSPVCKDWKPIKPETQSTTLKAIQALELSLDLGPKFGTVAAGQLKKVRDALNMTQETFATRMSVSVASVNRWETGKTTPKRRWIIETLLALANTYLTEEGE